ncbi:MAG: hypothetical protein AAFO95_14425 [Cyanobacteria bacterium J06600_6]
MYEIKTVICRSEYWLVIYQKNKLWKFSIYLPENKIHFNANEASYPSRSKCINGATEEVKKIVQKIAE